MTTRGALVGYGAIAQHGHLPRWRSMEGVDLVGVSDLRFAEGQESVDGLPAFASYDAMLDALRPDFVDICTPPSSHAALVEEALGRGIHVFCEKPLLVTREALDRVTEAHDAADAVLFTVDNWRHAPILDTASRWVAEGRVGEVQEILWNVERTGPSKIEGGGPNWRLDPAISGGGILVDHGWHALYLLLEWLGHKPDTVTATLERRRHVDLEVEDTATVRLHAGPARADLFLTWAGDARQNRARIQGKEGVLDILDDHLVLERENEREEAQFDSALSGGSSHPDWFDKTAAEFFSEIEGWTARGTNFNMASTCFCVLEAAWRSAANGVADVPVAP